MGLVILCESMLRILLFALVFLLALFLFWVGFSPENQPPSAPVPEAVAEIASELEPAPPSLDHLALFLSAEPRSLEEIASAIDAISLDELNAYLARRKFDGFTITSIGPVELKPPVGTA